MQALRKPKSSRGPERNYKLYRMSPKEVLRYGGVFAALVFLFSFLFFNSLLPGAAAGVPILYFYMKRKSRLLAEKRRTLLRKEFLSAVTVFGDYLRSGHSVENAILESRREIAEIWGEESDIVREWKEMAVKLSLNETAEEVFRDFGMRSGIEEVRDFSEIFGVVKRSGGQVGEVVDRAAGLLSGIASVEEQIETMVTAKKFEQMIMNIMPAAILLYVRVASPELLESMYTTWTGRVIMGVCLAVYALAVLWAQKIIEIRV